MYKRQLEDLGNKQNNASAKILADTLDRATSKLLENNKSPSRRSGELDNRGSHFYLAMYWAQELATQQEDKKLAAQFTEIAKALADNEEKIVQELNAVQGNPADIGGYYQGNPELITKVMRPSPTLNAII